METHIDIQQIIDDITNHPNWPSVLERTRLGIDEQRSAFPPREGCRLYDTPRIMLDFIYDRLVRTSLTFFGIGNGDTRATFFVNGYAVKIAMNQEGVLDNRSERLLYERIDRSLRKHLAAYLGGDEDDHIAVFELAAPLTRREFMRRRHDLHGILLKMAATGSYIMDCHDPDHPEQWGQIEGVPVILDYADNATSVAGDGYPRLIEEMLWDEPDPDMNETDPTLTSIVRAVTHHRGWPSAVALMNLDMYTQVQDLDMSAFDIADNLSDVLDLPLLGNGSSRATFLVNGHAVKIPLNTEGRDHNRAERDLYASLDPSIQTDLAPILYWERDLAVYRLAKPMDEKDYIDWSGGLYGILKRFSDHQVYIFDCHEDGRPDQWGLLDGRPVLLDYADIVGYDWDGEDYLKVIGNLLTLSY